MYRQARRWQQTGEGRAAVRYRTWASISEAGRVRGTCRNVCTSVVAICAVYQKPRAQANAGRGLGQPGRWVAGSGRSSAETKQLHTSCWQGRALQGCRRPLGRLFAQVGSCSFHQPPVPFRHLEPSRTWGRRRAHGGGCGSAGGSGRAGRRSDRPGGGSRGAGHRTCKEGESGGEGRVVHHHPPPTTLGSSLAEVLKPQESCTI